MNRPDNGEERYDFNDLTGGTRCTWGDGRKFYAADDSEPFLIAEGETRVAAKRRLNAKIMGDE